MFPIRDTIPRRNVPVMTWTLILVNCIVFLFEIGLPPDALERFFYRMGHRARARDEYRLESAWVPDSHWRKT
jgi:membrane associated rhomboid family serine protease